jgi:hypothetical protein
MKVSEGDMSVVRIDGIGITNTIDAYDAKEIPI